MSDVKPTGPTGHYRNGLPGDRSASPGWENGAAARYALAWEQVELDRLVADVFGYHALQLGLPSLAGLRANRMPDRWLLIDEQSSCPRGGEATVTSDTPGAALQGDFHQLPFPSSSLDLVVMPHTLEVTADPHLTLREVERVLRPEGRIVLTGFNPASLWGAWRRLRIGPWRQAADHRAGVDPLRGDWVGYWRLRDWLRLLSFEVEGGRFGCYLPPASSASWRGRLNWLEPVGDRWWPVLGSVYAVSAVKRVRGMRMVGLARRSPRMAGTPAVATSQHPRQHVPRRLPRDPSSQDGRP